MKKPLFWLVLFILWIVVAWWLFNEAVLSLKNDQIWPTDDDEVSRISRMFAA